MSTSSPSSTSHAYRLTLLERAVILGALCLSAITGALFALLMPWTHASATFASIWGTSLGALTMMLAAIRVHDRMRHTIHALEKKLAQTPRTLPIIPSYAITPEAPRTPPAAPFAPAPHITPAPLPRHSFHTLDDLSGEQINPLPAMESPQLPTEPIEAFALPLEQPAPTDPEVTIPEGVRSTASHEVPGAVLMSMAELDAEMTPIHTVREEQAATRPFTTPAPLLTEMLTGSLHHDEEATVQAQKQPQHFDNRATMPLDPGVVQTFISDQRNTQKIEDLPGMISGELRRRAISTEES